MSEAPPTSATARSKTPSGAIPAAKPKWAFWKGLLTGAVFEIPLLAATVWVLAHVGIGDPEVELMHVVRFTTVFAGLAALFTAGGIGRLAAYVTVAKGRRRAVIAAARAHAIASAGLLVIAMIPLGHFPVTPSGWVGLAAAGLVPGLICGALIGFVCSGVTPVNLTDVWLLAQRPTGALRQLIDPRDLVKLGAALRTRTTNLFEGIFEPAPLPPEKQPPDKAPAKPAEPAPPSDADRKG